MPQRTANTDMAAQKWKFAVNWDDYINELNRLGHYTDQPETWNEIKRLSENMRQLVHKVADELYDSELPESGGQNETQGA